MKFNQLFKRDVKGKIRVFYIAVYRTLATYATIHTKAGVYDGTLVENERILKTGKNIGKKNATSAYEQAVKEAKSDFKKKKTGGYQTLRELGWDEEMISVTTKLEFLKLKLPDIAQDGDGRIKPMLLKKARTPNFPVDVDERKDKKRVDVEFPIIADIKRDGVCTLAIPTLGLSTRGGKDRLTPKGEKWNAIVPQIVSELHWLWKKLEDLGMPMYTFHGETYLHGKTLQDIQKANKKRNIDSGNMMLYIFDIVELNMSMSSRRYRLKQVQEVAKSYGLKYIRFELGTKIGNEKDLFEFEDSVIDQGYEGVVVRNPAGTYVPAGYSKDVLKMVRMDENEFKIVGVEPMIKAPDQGMFICSIPIKFFDGVQDVVFKVVPQFDHSERRAMIVNPEKYIGKMLTCIHRGYTDSGIPRIATGKCIRELNT